MTMWKMKRCPRCHGDIFLGNDLDGWFEQCVQCSYRQDLKPLAETSDELVRVGKTSRKSRDSEAVTDEL